MTYLVVKIQGIITMHHAAISNIAGYCFCDLGPLPDLKETLLDFCSSLGLRGTILLSPEGINLTLAGRNEDMDAFLERYETSLWLPQMILHRTYSENIPFRRLLVKLKQKIIAFGSDEVDPKVAKAQYIHPQELKAWYQEKADFICLDTRNDYEVRLGTFEGAQHLDITCFQSFVEKVQALLPLYRDTPVVTACTGGVRCEKAALFMEKAGFNKVYQLHGGFLQYFKECGDAFYQGDCFVFDHRVALTPALTVADVKQCYACRSPLMAEDLTHPLYIKDVSCSYCKKY